MTTMRATRTMAAIVLAFWAFTLALFAYTYLTENAALQMRVAGLGSMALYAICVWHCVVVRGARPAIAFFGLAAVLAFGAEYLGDNYGLIFGAYHYTDALGPRVGGVPVLIVFVWGTVVYSAFAMVDWLARRHHHGPTGWGPRIGYALLVGLTSGLVTAAWDLMADPLSVSGVWQEVLGSEAWWWWVEGGPYLPDLESWKGGAGIPVENFVGWVLVPATIVAVFALAFPTPARIDRRSAAAVPVLVYGFLYLTLAGGLIEMAWFDPGLTQAVLIGTFTMGPMILLGLLSVLTMDKAPAPG
jgi:putative membrane protein